MNKDQILSNANNFVSNVQQKTTRPGYLDWSELFSTSMKTRVIAQPRWSTASFGDSADTSQLELSALQAHLTLCKRPRGKLFAIQLAAQAVHGFVAPRFVTSLVVVALLIGLAYLVL
jgi:hypothetical protein